MLKYASEIRLKMQRVIQAAVEADILSYANAIVQGFVKYFFYLMTTFSGIFAFSPDKKVVWVVYINFIDKIKTLLI